MYLDVRVKNDVSRREDEERRISALLNCVVLNRVQGLFIYIYLFIIRI